MSDKYHTAEFTNFIWKQKFGYDFLTSNYSIVCTVYTIFLFDLGLTWVMNTAVFAFEWCWVCMLHSSQFKSVEGRYWLVAKDMHSAV